MRPASAGILSATCCADPDPVGRLLDDRLRSSVTTPPSVETRFTAAFEYLDERPVRLLERVLKSCWNPAARALDRRSGTRLAAVRPSLRRTVPCSLRAAGPGPPPGRRRSRRARRRRGWRRPVRIFGSSRSELLVSAKTARVQRDTVGPDRERGEKEQQAGDDEHDPDGSRAAAALSAARLGAGGRFALRAHRGAPRLLGAERERLVQSPDGPRDVHTRDEARDLDR